MPALLLSALLISLRHTQQREIFVKYSCTEVLLDHITNAVRSRAIRLVSEPVRSTNSEVVVLQPGHA